jgi:phosphate butyryltransferase
MNAASATVTEKRPEKRIVLLDCRCTNQAGKDVITGTAEVIAPSERVRRPRVELPDVQLSRHERFRTLLARAAGQPPVPTAVAYPCDALSLGAAAEAAQAGLIAPILVGPATKIRTVALAAGIDIAPFRLVDVPAIGAAAAQAVALVRNGEAPIR